METACPPAPSGTFHHHFICVMSMVGRRRTSLRRAREGCCVSQARARRCARRPSRWSSSGDRISRRLRSELGCVLRHAPPRRFSDGFTSPPLAKDLVESLTNRSFRDVGSDDGPVVTAPGVHHASHRAIAPLPRHVPFDGYDPSEIARKWADASFRRSRSESVRASFSATILMVMCLRLAMRSRDAGDQRPSNGRGSPQQKDVDDELRTLAKQPNIGRRSRRLMIQLCEGRHHGVEVSFV